MNTKFLVLELVIMSIGFSTLHVKAQAVGCTSPVAGPGLTEFSIHASAMLSLQVDEQRYTGEAQPSQFFNTELQQTIGPGQRIFLSSTADGTGYLCTDDKVIITVQPSGKSWSWDFRSKNGMAIIPIQPVELTNLFEPGVNSVTITLIDLKPPAYSSSSYYLIVVGDPVTSTASPAPTLEPTATATLTSTPTPPPPTATATTTPTSSPTSTDTTTETFTPTSSNTPTQTKTNTATLTPSPTEVTADTPTIVPIQFSAGSSGKASSLPLIAGIFALASVVTTGLWLLIRRHVTVDGELEVYKDGKFVTQFDLGSFRKPRVTIGGHADVFLKSEAMPSQIAVVRAQRNDNGNTELWIDLLHEEDGSVDDSLLLYDGVEIPLRKYGYSLRYRSVAIKHTDFEKGEQYA